ncbi:rho GDP-dissociation inhibitor 1-like [Amphiura filiformis]|uniref:rho GDP-dissociation inhibitor 1-like n=1 Tax=Amphiura filiformis TaxID=82378 RepID=UPI003B21E3BD
MAEEPHQDEELVPAEEPAETPGYKPPAKKTLEEIKQLDEEDESLKKYKEQLLKGAEGAVKDPSKGPEMKPIKITLMSEGREDKTVDLTDLEALKKHSFVIKEGVEYKIKITFQVYNDIVCGLKYMQTTHKKGIAVDKQKIMMGSYGPKTEDQEYTTPTQDAPKGLLGRGSYVIKSKFQDDDKNEYAAWAWNFEIKKDWD